MGRKPLLFYFLLSIIHLQLFMLYKRLNAVNSSLLKIMLDYLDTSNICFWFVSVPEKSKWYFLKLPFHTNDKRLCVNIKLQ